MAGRITVRRCALLRICILAAAVAAFMAVMSPGLAFATEAPIAAWSFDEGHGPVVHDLYGTHDGSLEHSSSDSPPEYVNGRFGDALRFQGQGYQCVNVPQSPDLELQGSFTVETWVKPEGTGVEEPLIFKEAPTYESHMAYMLYLGLESNGKVGGYVEEPGWKKPEVTSEKLPVGKWTHLALTFDGEHLRLYINGELVDTTAANGPQASKGPLKFGCAEVYGQDFEGRLDEVRIYDRAISEEEVQHDMTTALQTPDPSQAPVAEYSFDEEASPGKDLSGEGRNATIEGAKWTSHGRYGGALEFNGESDSVTIPASPGLHVEEEFTLEAWVRPEGENEWAPLITKETEGSKVEPWFLYEGSWKSNLPYGGLENEAPGETYSNANEAIPKNAWSHLALTFDGSMTRLYVDGKLVDQDAGSAPGISEGKIEIGADGLGNHFKGRIDEVRIYNRALATGEVGSDMESPIQTPKAGPVAEYSFDEGSEESAADLSGNGHTATIEGAKPAPGRYGKGLDFNGEEDCVSIPVDEELQATEEFTVEAWVRPEGSAEEGLPVIAMNDENSGLGEEQFSYELFAGQNEAPKGWVRKDKEVGTWGVYGEEPLPEKSWSHLTFTDDGNVIRLYVDGKLGNEENSTDVAPPLTEAEGPLTIGCGIKYGAFRHFKGRIDEVRVYNRALNAAEVESDAEAPIQTPKQGPVAEYSFDEEGESFHDDSGDGNVATATGSVAWTQHGRYGGAVELNGKEGCITVAATEELQLTEEFTLEAWVRPVGEGEEALPVISMADEHSPAEEEPYSYELLAGQKERPKAWVRKGGESGFRGVYGEGPLPQNVWTQITLTDDGSKIRLYEDGHLAEDELATNVAPRLTTAEGPLQIGCGVFNGTFHGRIDEVRIYNRALKEAEVQSDVESPIQTPKSGPVAAYSFDENEGTTVHDATGDKNEGTVEGGATWVPGRYGDALRFVEHEGSPTQCVTIADTPQLRLEEEFTLEAWVRPEEWLGSASIISKELESGKGQSYSLGIGFTKYGKVEGYAENQGLYSAEAVEEDRWVHVAFTYDGDKAQIYINGQLVSTKWVGAREMASSGPLRIGCDSPELGARFKGRIDEVRVYDRALNQPEVASDMESPVQTPRRGPVAGYSFDEGEGSTVEDLTGNEHTATVHNAEWTTRGKYGGAMEFDAARKSYLSIPGSPELNFTEGFTLEAWVRPAEGSGEYEPLITKQITGSKSQPYFLYEGSSEPGKPYGGTQANTKEESFAHAGEALPTNAWSHVALTFEGTRAKLYVNGELIDENYACPPINGEGDLEIGGATEVGSYFSGRIDEVRVFNRALTGEEARDITPPSEPTAFSAIGEEEGVATINWNWSTDPVMNPASTVSGVALYDYRSRFGSSEWTPWQTTSIPAFQIEGPEVGSRLEVQVLAQDKVGNDSPLVDRRVMVMESPFTPEDLGVGDDTDGPYDVYPEPRSNEEEVSRSRIEASKSLSVHPLYANPEEEKLCAGTGENPCFRYNGFRAGSYAQAWSLNGQSDQEAQKNHNQKFDYFGGNGGDCTNFASQVLHAGGMLFMRASGLNDPNAYANGENNVDAYSHGQGAWWSDYANLEFLAPGEVKYDYTRAWAGAYGLYEHLTEYGLGHVLGEHEHVKRGDLVFWSEEGDLSPEYIRHTQVVSKVTPQGIWVAQHSKNYEENLGNVLNRIANHEHRYWHHDYELYFFQPVYGAANIG